MTRIAKRGLDEMLGAEDKASTLDPKTSKRSRTDNGPAPHDDQARQASLLPAGLQKAPQPRRPAENRPNALRVPPKTVDVVSSAPIDAPLAAAVLRNERMAIGFAMAVDPAYEKHANKGRQLLASREAIDNPVAPPFQEPSIPECLPMSDFLPPRDPAARREKYSR